MSCKGCIKRRNLIVRWLGIEDMIKLQAKTFFGLNDLNSQKIRAMMEAGAEHEREIAALKAEVAELKAAILPDQ